MLFRSHFFPKCDYFVYNSIVIPVSWYGLEIQQHDIMGKYAGQGISPEWLSTCFTENSLFLRPRDTNEEMFQESC